MKEKVIQLIKQVYPWAVVARIDLDQNGYRSLWVYEREATRKTHDVGYAVSWCAGGEANELHPFGIFAPMLGAEDADPNVWELRLD